MTIISIDAGPGSGKSTTLEHAFLFMLTGRYHFLPNQEQVNICHHVATSFPGVSAAQVVFLAFNTTTKDALQSKLPSNCKAYTFGGLGQSLLFRRHHYQALDKLRGERLLAQLLGRPLSDLPYQERLQYYNLLRYISSCKEELLLPSEETFHFIREKYNLGEPPRDITLATKLLTLMSTPNGSIEFIDQVWMGLQTITQPLFEVAFVDEAQDLSALRLEFALKVARNCVFCGDPFQSINAFAGADHLAFEKIRSVSNIALPLKESFRLPPNHIEHANTIRRARITAFKLEPGPIESFSLSSLPSKINSFLSNTQKDFSVKWRYNPNIYTKDPNPQPPSEQIQGPCTNCGSPDHWRPDCPDLNPIQPPPPPARSSSPPPGTPYDPTTHIWTITPPQEMRDPEQHLIIGRTNAEIFQVAIALLKEGIGCRIIRRKEDQDIKTTLTYYLQDKLKATSNKTIDGLLSVLNKDKAKAQAMPYRKGAVLYEKSNCLIHLCGIANSISDIPDLLEALTSEKHGTVRLCTIHKAKGMEAHFIYILFPPVAHPKAETPQEIEQEKNLEFVSETRSKFYKAYVKE